LNAATQWLERSLDDSANRRLVLPDALMTADAVLSLAAHVAEGLRLDEATVAARVRRELPFMATETILMKAVLAGGDRQELHERIRRHSLEAHREVAAGGDNPLLDRLAADPAFGLSREEIEATIEPRAFIGRSAEQVDELLAERVEPVLAKVEAAEVEAPRV
jgi:adenylosuccinate lyase